MSTNVVKVVTTNTVVVRTFGSANVGVNSVWGTITGTLADQTDLQATLDAKALDAEVVKILATDASGFAFVIDEDDMVSNDPTKIPTQQSVKAYADALVTGGIVLQGDWDADTNTPDITGTTVTGHTWRVSVAGNTNLGGITDWDVGDLAMKTATGWLKIDNEDVAAVWGNITGTLSNQTDLWTELQSALHKAVSGEISAMSAKVAPVGADLLLTEDSADGFSKKKITIDSLPEASVSQKGQVNTTAQTFAGAKTFNDGVVSDSIDEKTPAAGVTVDGVLIKDGQVDGRDPSIDGAKLDTIEPNADVTTPVNVDAAGATMNTDTDLTGNGYFLDEDNMASNSATQVPSQQSVKAYVDAITQGSVILQGDWDADTNTPDITTTTTTGHAWRVSVAGSTNLGGITDWKVGDMAVKTATGWIKVDNEDIAAVWGNITGTLADQTDLQNELDARDNIPPDNVTLEQAAGPILQAKDGGMTNIKLADMADATIKGRQSGAGTGAPQNLTAAQVRTIIGAATGVIDGLVSIAAQTFAGLKDFIGGIKTDTIAESSADAGVTADGVVLKDGDITAGDAQLTNLATADDILSTDVAGNVQHTGIKAETTAELGSLLNMVPFTTAPVSPDNYDFWVREEGGSVYFEWVSSGTTYSIEAGALP